MSGECLFEHKVFSSKGDENALILFAGRFLSLPVLVHHHHRSSPLFTPPGTGTNHKQGMSLSLSLSPSIAHVVGGRCDLSKCERTWVREEGENRRVM